MTDPCDAFYVGQVVLSAVPGVVQEVVVARVENGKVFITPAVGGPEFAFDCAQFWTGFYVLLDILGIPHP